MAKKRTTSTTDLPLSETPIESNPEAIWDPAGTNTAPHMPAQDRGAHDPDQPQQAATPPAVDDPDLQEFLQAINDAKDPDSEFVAITPETTP